MECAESPSVMFFYKLQEKRCNIYSHKLKFKKYGTPQEKPLMPGFCYTKVPLAEQSAKKWMYMQCIGSTDFAGCSQASTEHFCENPTFFFYTCVYYLGDQDGALKACVLSVKSKQSPVSYVFSTYILYLVQSIKVHIYPVDLVMTVHLKRRKGNSDLSSGL